MEAQNIEEGKTDLNETTPLVEQNPKLRNWHRICIQIVSGICITVATVLIAGIITLALGTVIALSKDELNSTPSKNMLIVINYGFIGMFFVCGSLAAILMAIYLGYIIYRMIIWCYYFKWSWCCEKE